MALLGRPTPKLRYQKAWMLIQFARNYAILGDTAKRKERAEEAHRLMAELVAEMPSDLEKLDMLSMTLAEKGDALVAKGDLAAALQSYKESLAISERLAEADPDNAGWQYDVGTRNERMGDVLMAVYTENLIRASSRRSCTLILRPSFPSTAESSDRHAGDNSRIRQHPRMPLQHGPAPDSDRNWSWVGRICWDVGV
jgi:tetratricopeptide (TPR) repeat protein